MLCSQCGNVAKPVIAIDIDSTLGDHHGHFQRFASGYVGRQVGPKETWTQVLLDEPSLYPYDEEFSDWLQLEKQLYRDIKLAYRQGGMKRTMPVFPYAAEIVHALREAGAEVWLCTTRPYLRLDNIDPDTREWLRRNNIEYDGLIYGEDKYHRLASIVGSERVVAVLDDLPEMFDEAEALGLHAIQKQNGHRGTAVRYPAVATLIDAGRLLGDLLREHEMIEVE